MSKKPAPAAQTKQEPLFTEEEKNAIENKDKALITQMIKNYIQENNDYAQQIYELTQQLQYHNQECDSVIHKLQQDISISLLKQEKLEQQLKALRDEKLQRVTTETQKYESELLHLEQDQEYQETANKYDNEKLDEKYTNLAPIQLQEEMILKELKDLQNQCRNVEFEHHDELRRIQNVHFTQDNNLFAIQQNQINEKHKNSLKEINEQVQKEQSLQTQLNKKLRRELVSCQQQFKLQNKEKMDIVNSFKTQRRDQQLDQIKIQQYQILNQRKLRKFELTNEKKSFLKQYLQDQVQNYTKTIEIEKHKYKSIEDDYIYKIQELEDDLKSLSFKQIKIDRLAREILNQREEIETFLQESIQNLQIQIKEQKSTRRDTYQNSLDTSKQPKLNYEDLDLEEKEKIFRVLLLKINKQVKI